MKTILQAENLEKTYRVGSMDVHALRGVSLEMKEGEFVAIMGPSGCGKSTMLHLLGGLLTPTQGRIVIDGEDMTNVSDDRRTDIRRRKIGFVFQRFNLFPTLTADGNLRLAERIQGSNGKGGNAERRREVLSLLKLENKMHHKPLELSGGEQQRVVLARALVGQPKYLLADEPTGNLDEQTASQILDLLERLQAQFQLTSVIVTHSSALASRCTRTLRLAKGGLFAIESNLPPFRAVTMEAQSHV